MKEKRYFCDYWFGRGGSNKIETLIIILSLIVITSIFCIIHYNVLLHTNELDSYSESTYQYLDEIANEVIQEGKGINLLALPDDVVKYEITSTNNEIIFKYYLDNNKGMLFAQAANMTVELSDNFEIISKNPNYSSEEDFIIITKFLMFFGSAILGFMIWLGFIILSFIICTIVAFVSRAKKNKNLS